MNQKEVPVLKKSNLTINEAVAYSGIGENKLRKLAEDENYNLMRIVGRKN